jgi:hypothetical protein
VTAYKNAGELLVKTVTAASLWGSVATFRRDTVAKAAFILLNQFDLALTIFALNLGLSELNPFLGHLVNIPILLIIVKIVIPVLVGWLIPGKLLLPSVGLLALVTMWNLKELVFFLL